MDFIPTFFQHKIKKHTTLVRIVSNTGWLDFEKLVRMTLGLAASVLAARHLGASKLGSLNYAIGLVSLLSSFVYLGPSGW